MRFFFSRAKLLLSNYTSALESLCNAQGGGPGHVSWIKGIAEKPCKARREPCALATRWQDCKQRAGAVCLAVGCEGLGLGLPLPLQQTSPGCPLCSVGLGGTLSSASSRIQGPQADVLRGGSLTCALRGPALLQLFSTFFLCLGHGHLELCSSPEPLHNLIISSCWPDCLSP